MCMKVFSNSAVGCIVVLVLGVRVQWCGVRRFVRVYVCSQSCNVLHL